ncbi:hypothetical protein N7495_008468 [Penicillium taxi]|uniref:uncharacterized protein n=1 Tax=Penicillium taxi TaxID=168475 RepID=UPI00254533EB|nr:uncharacterized protein N7495_008468 [Penicillium taxi]KAJ5888427.1 hypothetical protein N7495_008468 [Penicillium taxi]
MADKEATVYIVDVSCSMGERRHGREITDLEWAMQYVWDKITTTVYTGRKGATLATVALRTDGTSNELEDDPDYSNISVVKNLGQALMPDIRKIRDVIKPSGTDAGDAISAVVVAIQMIRTFCKKLKYKREIVLVTNATGVMNSENLDQIIAKIKEDNIKLTILGPDFDDAEYGVKEEDKDNLKKENEILLREFAEGCDGNYGTLDEAVSWLETPRLKVTKGLPSFKGFLQLGDASKYDTAVRIPVERYFQTYVAKPPSASSFVISSGNAPEKDGAQLSGSQAPSEGENLTLVRQSRAYQITDESAPGGKVEVERDDLAKGYEYGRTAVHISQTDENITKLETFAAMDLIGFVPKENYDRYQHMSNTNVIIASKGNDKAALALSSFIHALDESESYAVARLNYECLIEVQVPFSEDVRSYRFPPLDKVITVSGKIVTEHRNLPTDSLQEAMSNYVDSMELGLDDDEEAEVDDLINDSYSPYLHRVETAVRKRAVNPNAPVLEPAHQLLKFANPDKNVIEKSKVYLEKLISEADVKKVPPKTKGRKRQRETEKPLSGLDVDALLNLEPKRAKISAENAIPEFKQLLQRAQSVDETLDAVKQLNIIIETQIKHSFGEANYNRVVEELGTMREELVDYEVPVAYNDVLRKLKEKILREELGGDRQELWYLIRTSKLGLIEHTESEHSQVSEEDAKQFLSAK